MGCTNQPQVAAHIPPP
jgi:hypothetical protein